MKRLPLLLLAAVVCAQTAKLPTFEEYKVSDLYKGKLAAPKLGTPLARQYRSRIEEAAKGGPNFAGKFTIAQWGCGSSCIQMAVIDERTGAVYPGPVKLLSFGLPITFEDKSSSRSDSFEPLVFQADSRLLLVRGCPGEDSRKCGSFYYEWAGSKFRLAARFVGSLAVCE